MGYNIHLRFPANISTEPVVCHLTRKFDLDFNITKAQISTGRDGYMILEILGDKEKLEQAKKYLEEQGISVSDVAQRIQRNEKSCVECGLCTAICPTSALYMDNERHVVFDSAKCVVCTRCVKICPINAMQADLETVNE